MYRYLIINVILITYCTYVISLDCYKCRSDGTPKCAVNPDKGLDIIECSGNDKCAIAIFKKVTYRDCLSKLPGGGCSGPLCHTCDSNLCNIDLFPKNRWTCYQCSGAECVNVTRSKLKPLPCPLYVEEDRCFTDIIGIHHIIRGCVSGEEKICPNICLKCDKMGCNNEQGVFNSTCQSCQWMPGESIYPKDFACKRMQSYNSTTPNTNQCQVNRDDKTCVQKTLLGHKEKCFTHWNSLVNVVVRGCSSTMGAYPSGKLWECYGDNCNSDCIQMKCNICDTDKDPNCRNNTRMIHEKDCPDDTFSCFSCEDNNNKLERGCGYQKSSIDRHCNNCYDDEGCNKDVVRNCFKCTSTKNMNCAKWIDLKEIDREKCTDPNEKCVVTKTSKYVVRGCESKVKECTEADPDCRRCDGSLCNRGAYE